MRWVVLAGLAWAAVSYFGGVGHELTPPTFKASSSLDDCHCFIQPNHGLYR